MQGREAAEERRAAEEEAERLRLAAEEERRRVEEERRPVLDELAELAAAFQLDWDGTEQSLAQDPTKALRIQELRLGLCGLLLVEKKPGGKLRYLKPSLANLLIHMDPEIEPLVNGVSITTEGLKRAALELVENPEDRVLADTLRIVRTSDVLWTWSKLPGCAEGRNIERAWRAGIAALQMRIPLGPQRWQPSSLDADVASAWLLLTIVSPDGLEQLHERVDKALAGPAGKVAWWRSLAEETAVTSLALALVSQGTAEEEAKRVEDAQVRLADKQKSGADPERRQVSEEPVATLTPLDIRHKEFRQKRGGYNAHEVDACLDSLAAEVERLRSDPAGQPGASQDSSPEMSPSEVRGRRFKRSLRGYSADEVSEFLGEVATQLEFHLTRVAERPAKSHASRPLSNAKPFGGRAD